MLKYQREISHRASQMADVVVSVWLGYVQQLVGVEVAACIHGVDPGGKH